MPGTIHVSVLDFQGLSFSSILIKASMGKREYQIWDKGDFSFPLTTLRDNLIITLQDAEGNQISQAGVRTMSIVENVVWDDLFPLEGGGKIHMKLQFVLSDEERKRIRTMRETALKKKQEKILRSTLSLSNAEITRTASSLHTHEVSDSRTSGIIYKELASAGDVAMRANQLFKPHTLDEKSESTSAIKKGLLQNRTTPNSTDRRNETSSSPMPEGFRVSQLPFVDKVQAKVLHPDFQGRHILSQEPSSSFGSSETVSAENKSVYSRLGTDPAEKPHKQNPNEKVHTEDVKGKSSESISAPFSREAKELLLNKSQTPHTNLSPKLQEASLEMEFPNSIKAENIDPVSPKVLDKNEKQGPVKKAPGNIRKMISAFETSLAQDQGPAIKPLGVKSLSSRVAMVRLLNDQVLKGTAENLNSSSGRLENPVVSSLGRLKNSFSTGDLQRTAANILRKGEQTRFHKDVGLKSSQAVTLLTEASATESQPKAVKASLMDELRSAQREIIRKKNKKSSDDIKRVSAIDEATISGRMEEERSGLKSAHQKTIQKKMAKFNLLSSGKEARVSGRVHEERDPTGLSIIQDEARSASKEIKTNELGKSNSIVRREVRSVDEETNNELAASNLMRSSTPEAATVSGRVIEERVRDSCVTSVVKQELIEAQGETNTMDKSSRELMRPSILEAGANLGRLGQQQDSVGMSDAEKEKRISLVKSSHEISIQEESKDNVEYFSHQSSGPRIFPDEDGHLCATAVGDEVATSPRGSTVKEKYHERKMTSLPPENIRKDMVGCGTDIDAPMDGAEEKSNPLKHSNPDRSADDASTGPLGQVLKIAIIVGFGVLILLTRQRNPRKAKRKETVPPELYMDQKGSFKGQLRNADIF